MFYRCGHQFYNRYIKGIIIPPGIAARKGSSVHSGAEHSYRHVIAHGVQAPLDEVCDATRDTFVQLVKDEGVWFADEDLHEKKELLSAGLDEAVNATKFYHKEVASDHSEIALIEERLYADIGLGMDISGKPDVVANRKLIDLKTAGKRWNAGREQKEIQPVLYKILLRENGFGDLPAEYVILTNMKGKPKSEGLLWDNELKVCGDLRPVKITENNENVVKLRIRKMIAALERGDFMPAYTDTWWCSPKWCGYYGGCPFASK